MKELLLSITFCKLLFILTSLWKLPKAINKFSLGKSTVIVFVLIFQYQITFSIFLQEFSSFWIFPLHSAS